MKTLTALILATLIILCALAKNNNDKPAEFFNEYIEPKNIEKKELHETKNDLPDTLTKPFVEAQIIFSQVGKASFYADKFEGLTTASGELYYHSHKTCAHLTLPFGTLLNVTNLSNNRSVIVKVNDRGPFVDNRIIDLSRSAAKKLDFIKEGLSYVRIEMIE